MSLLTGDPKESYYIGSLEDTSVTHLNQWPSEGMALLCIQFIRNGYCNLVFKHGFFSYKLNLGFFFFWQGHSRIAAKLETYNGIFILETTVSLISSSKKIKLISNMYCKLFTGKYTCSTFVAFRFCSKQCQ